MTMKIEVIDERSITLPREGCSEGETEQVGKAITTAAQDGYQLARAEAVNASDYRGESYAIGVKLTFKRS